MGGWGSFVLGGNPDDYVVRAEYLDTKATPATGSGRNAVSEGGDSYRASGTDYNMGAYWYLLSSNSIVFWRGTQDDTACTPAPTGRA